MTDIAMVKGIGPATAGIFVKSGFATAADIATASIGDLATIPGVKEARARALIDAARALVAGTQNAEVDTPGPRKKPKASGGKKGKAKKSDLGKPGKSKKKDKKKKKKKNKKKGGKKK